MFAVLGAVILWVIVTNVAVVEFRLGLSLAVGTIKSAQTISGRAVAAVRTIMVGARPVILAGRAPAVVALVDIGTR